MISTPTIHMNGSGKASLLDGLCLQMATLRQALQTMQENSPNGRDYYPQGDGATQQAVDQHRARFKAINGVLQELETIAEAIA